MSKDDRTKSTFTVVVEWSDCSPHSPSRTGQLPLAAITPTGERVELSCEDIQVAQYQRNVPYNSWVKMGHGISAKESGWSDGDGRSYGRSGAKVEILAPEGTKFLFERGCDSCGESLGEEEDRLAEEQRQEESEHYQENILKNSEAAAFALLRNSFTRDQAGTSPAGELH